MEDSQGTSENGGVYGVNWEHLYILTGHWNSDMEFYLEDIRFLQRIIDRYSLWIRSSENTAAVNNLMSDLQRLTSDGKNVLEMAQDHLRQLAGFIENKKETDPEWLVNHHARLEKDLAAFVKNFRVNRQEVYRVSEKLMNSEDISDHLGE